MNDKKLEEIIQFSLGKNATRLKEQECPIYTPDDFEKDLHSINQSEGATECIISLIKSKAAPVSRENESLCITSNFLKCSFDQNVLDPWYFCYQFNRGKKIEEQIARYSQGSTISVKKLTAQIIGNVIMEIPDLEKQRVIGNLYRTAIVQRDLLIRQAENMMDLAVTMIRKYEED